MTFSMSSLAYPHSYRKGTKLPLKQRHRASRSVSPPPHSSMEIFLFSDVQAEQTLHCAKFVIARKPGQDISITTKPFLPHHSLSTLSIGVPAHLLTVRTHYHRLG